MEPNSHSNHVECHGLHFARPGKIILNGVDLAIERGKITAILGPSGTGKTTLLKLIGGELQPDSGKILINDQDLSQFSRKQLFAFRQSIGMLFQSGALFTDLNVFENVAFPLREHTQLPEALIRDIVLMKLEAVGLRGAQALSPSELSGGMARRVALARAIVLDPALMMYDEPFAGLDPIAVGVIAKLIKRLNQALGMTSIIVTHDVEVTAQICDTMMILSDGNIVAQGTPEQVMNNQNPQVQQFMQGLPDGVIPFHYPAVPFHNDLGINHD